MRVVREETGATACCDECCYAASCAERRGALPHEAPSAKTRPLHPTPRARTRPHDGAATREGRRAQTNKKRSDTNTTKRTLACNNTSGSRKVHFDLQKHIKTHFVAQSEPSGGGHICFTPFRIPLRLIYITCSVLCYSARARIQGSGHLKSSVPSPFYQG